MENKNDKPNLRELMRKVKKAISEGQCGPLVMSELVIYFADNWSMYEDQAEYKPCDVWLKEGLGNGWGLARWKRLAHAVEVLGESCRREWHHAAAVWAAYNIPADKIDIAKSKMRFAVRKNHGHILTYSQTMRALSDLVVREEKEPPECKDCTKLQKRCHKLEQLLKANGIPIPK